MKVWKPYERRTMDDGSRVIVYTAGEKYEKVCSRQVDVPHANGRPGTWKNTEYYLIKADGSWKQYWSLTDAKAAAEKNAEEKEKVSEEPENHTPDCP